MRDLGQRHAGYGDAPADYKTVACALIGTLEGLRQRFHTGASGSLDQLLLVLAGQMMAGASERRSDAAPSERRANLGFTEMARLV